MPDPLLPAAASVLLRIAFAALFLATAVPKFKDPQGTASYFSSLFEKTWLPGFTVAVMSRVAGPIELALAIWLLSGWALPIAWLIAGLWTVALAFGMAVAGQHQQAALNFVYIGLAAAGIVLAAFDPFRLGL